MAVHYSMLKSSAKKIAEMYRKKGYRCSVYKLKVGYGVSVTRK